MNCQSLIETIILLLVGVANIITSTKFLPRISYENNTRQELREKGILLLTYINAVSASGYDWSTINVPARFRELCNQIHLLFPDGKASWPLKAYLEDVFQILYRINHRTNKELSDEEKMLLQTFEQRIRTEIAKLQNGRQIWRKARKFMRYTALWCDIYPEKEFICANLGCCRNCSMRRQCEARMCLIRLDAIDSIQYCEFEMINEKLYLVVFHNRNNRIDNTFLNRLSH